MKCFRSKAAALLIAGALGITANAAAQESRPADPDRPQDGPRSILLDPTAPAPALPELGAETPSAESDLEGFPDQDLSVPAGIEVEALEATGPGSVGIIAPASAEFPVTLWAGSRAATVNSLFSLTPSLEGAPAYQNLLRRLVLVSAPPPLAADESRRDSEMEFLVARLDRIAAMGDLESLQSMLARLGRDVEDRRIVAHAVTTNLLTGNYAAACSAATATPPVETDADWLKLAAFCRNLSGDSAGASLALELLREQEGRDPAFMTLISAQLRGETAELEPEQMQAATPLLLALADLQKITPPPTVVEAADPLVLARLATSPGIPTDIRLEAARKAARMGGFDADRLAQIYAAIEFRPDDLENVLLLVEDLEPGRADALLYQAALSAPDAARRSEIISLGFARAREAGAAPLYSLIMAPAVAALPPAPEIINFAPDAVRILLLAGRTEEAQNWYGYLQDEAMAENAKAAGFLVDLWPLIMVGAPMETTAYAPEALELWWRGRELINDENRDAQALTLFTLLESDGHLVPESLWTGLMNSPAATESGSVNLSVWRGLRQAADAGRVGETALMAVVTGGASGADPSPPVVVSGIARALKAVGLEADARAIAVAALIGRGL